MGRVAWTARPKLPISNIMGNCDPVVTAHKRLACAILARAVRDAKSGNGHSAEARRWLAGEGGDLAEILDILPERVTAWVDGLPVLQQEALPGL